MNYKPYLIFLSFIGFGLFVFFLASSGYYPILSVNGHFVSARTFWKNYYAGSVYYQNISKTYKSENENQPPLGESELKLSVINQLVENKLIDDEVHRELGKDLDYLVKNKIDKFTQDESLGEKAQALYGLDYEDFKGEILTPLAKQEVLVGRLFLKGEKIENWLAEAKKNSRVRIFSGEFYWDKEEVKVKSSKS